MEGKVPAWYWVGMTMLVTFLSAVSLVAEINMGYEVLR
jgi:hypothetical protein